LRSGDQRSRHPVRRRAHAASGSDADRTAFTRCELFWPPRLRPGFVGPWCEPIPGLPVLNGGWPGSPVHASGPTQRVGGAPFMPAPGYVPSSGLGDPGRQGSSSPAGVAKRALYRRPGLRPASAWSLGCPDTSMILRYCITTFPTDELEHPRGSWPPASATYTA